MIIEKVKIILFTQPVKTSLHFPFYLYTSLGRRCRASGVEQANAKRIRRLYEVHRPEYNRSQVIK